MATFSREFLSNLGQPAMTQSLFNLGTALGSVPGAMKAKRKKDTFDSLMSQAQQAMANNNPTELLRIAQELTNAGYTQQGLQLTELSKKATARLDDIGAGKSLLTGGPTEMRLAGKKYAEDGRVQEAMAMQKAASEESKKRGRGALSIYASKVTSGPDKKNLNDPKAKEGFFRIARAYGLENEAQSLLDDFLGSSDKSKLSFGDELVLRDEDGDYFTKRTIYNEQGQTKTVFTPLDSDSTKKKPKGNISIVSKTTGAGAFDKPDISGKETAQNEHNKLRVKASEAVSLFSTSLNELRLAQDLLKDLNTGGFTVAIATKMQQFFGVTPKNKGELIRFAQEQTMRNLSNFTGAISEGERQYSEGMSIALEKSNYQNEAILESLIRQTKRSIEGARLRIEHEKFEDYNKALLEQFGDTSEPSIKTVKWQDIKS